eukprot:scaffold421700_cov37-Prasinocladus_malaysianus.AAC.1
MATINECTSIFERDGSSHASCIHQVMVDKEVAEADGYSLKELAATGACVLIEGVLSKTPEGTEQAVELK